MNPVIFEDIDQTLIENLATKTIGSAGPSQLDADAWRRILASKTFGPEGMDLCKAIARLARCLCVTVLEEPNSIMALMACRLIPLDKDPGLRPIGVGEVLRRIIGKAVTKVLKADLQGAAGGLQLCVGLEGDFEAGVHGIREIFEDRETEGLIQVDVENALNSINRKILLHNIYILCPAIATYLQNCYAVPARLFVTGGVEIISEEGTTLGDPTSLPSYAIGMLPLMTTIKSVVNSTLANEHNGSTVDQHHKVRHAAFADGLTGTAEYILFESGGTQARDMGHF